PPRLRPSTPRFPYTTLFRSDRRLLRQTATRAIVGGEPRRGPRRTSVGRQRRAHRPRVGSSARVVDPAVDALGDPEATAPREQAADRKSTRLNSSHSQISYAD